MPLYEYQCKKCDHRFDLVRRLAVRDEPTPCPRCKSRRTARIEVQRIAFRSTEGQPAGLGDDFLDGGDMDMSGMGAMGGMGMDDFDDY